MVNYWTSKVLPKIKKVFENPKKVAAAEACKTFDEAKEEYSKEFEDKKTELQPKVIEIYEASTTEIKGLVKERKGSSLKKHAAAVEKFLDELAKIEFPGSKALCESAMGGPVSFVLEKVSTFIVVEEKKEPEEAPAPEGEVTATAADETVVKEKEIVVEHEPTATAEEVKPEEAVKVEETKAPSPEETKAPTTVECVPEAVEPPKP